MADVPVEDVVGAAERLKPYVPLVAIDWLRETPELRYKQIQGSLAFVDISGFTSLTERLSRKGKVGAEEMNDLLNDCFEALLTTASTTGPGSLSGVEMPSCCCSRTSSTRRVPAGLRSTCSRRWLRSGSCGRRPES